ncbi:MAG TPA: ribosome silencing factor [Candidatus Angelobacter sp.]|nr:ribosome silencing factor [Candidatus Angelobacter sp.]
MSLETRQQVAQAVKAVEEKKGENVAILEMDRNAGAFTDYFVLCSGTNPRQIQAISDEVERRLAPMGRRPTSLEGYNQAEWVLLDYVDFVVHIFSERARGFYDLERLWKSAHRLAPADLLKKPTARPTKKAASRAVSPKSKVKRKPTRSRAKATKRKKHK